MKNKKEPHYFTEDDIETSCTYDKTHDLEIMVTYGANSFHMRLIKNGLAPAYAANANIVVHEVIDKIKPLSDYVFKSIKENGKRIREDY